MNGDFEMDPGKVAADVATALTKEALSSGWNKVKGFFKDVGAEAAMQYGDAYEEYLANTTDKNRKVKTLIYRHIPKELYSFYVCIGIDYEGETIDTSSVTNLTAVSGKIVVTGTGGSGKSMMLRHLFLNTAETTNYIPVLIELRKFNAMETKDISLFQAVYQSLRENGFELEEKYFESSMREGAYVILLDGFDEVNRDKADRVTREIESLSDRYRDNKFIVSSRPADSFIGWNDFSEMTALPLSKKQALELIEKIEFDEAVKETFFKALDESLFDRYKSFASNPLLLTIMLLTFNNHASIPEKLNDFYEEAFATLFNMHDATKDCYVRDIRTDLGCEDFKTVFSYICFKSYFAGEFEFSETRLREYIQKAKDKFPSLRFSVDDFQEDLILSVCMLIKDGLNYRFAHRSFQEYFAAWYTCKLTDDIQSKLLTTWMGESGTARQDEYLPMLFNQQPEKVNKILFCPGILKLKALYESMGFSCGLLKHLFKGVRLKRKSERGEEAHYYTFLVIRDEYLCNTMIMTSRLNHYVYKNQQKLQVDDFVRRVKNAARAAGKRYKVEWGIDELLQLVSQEELLAAVEWFDDRYRFCLKVLEKNTSNAIGNKKKVATIIDEL